MRWWNYFTLTQHLLRVSRKLPVAKKWTGFPFTKNQGCGVQSSQSHDAMIAHVWTFLGKIKQPVKKKML